MNWLCKLIGHKHKGWDICSVWYNGGWCLRCNASTVSTVGDDVLRCRVFGHHNYACVEGDSDGYKITTPWCQRCHSAPASYFRKPGAG